MTKFYYNGKLVRTSANNIYTHAVIKGEKNGKYLVEGCRSTKEAAEQIISTKINSLHAKINDCKNAIKALEAGESGYTYTFKNRRYFNKFRPECTIEYYEGFINMNLLEIESIKKSWKVVELEAK